MAYDVVIPEMWAKAVDDAKTRDAQLILTIFAFVNEPEMLRDALRYAYEEGVTVIFAPNIKEGD